MAAVSLSSATGTQAGDEYDEPVYATDRVLRQRGPRLGRFRLQDMLTKLHPGLRPVPPGVGSCDDEGTDLTVTEVTDEPGFT